ncbi:hypothetical protein SMJ63A_80179 [Stenotrophomonas geniculata]
MAVGRAQHAQAAARAQTFDQADEVGQRHQAVALHGHHHGRRQDRGGVDAVQVDRFGQAQVGGHRCARDVLRAGGVEIVFGGHAHAAVDHFRRGIEALAEFFRGAVAEHGELPGQRQAMIFAALQLAQRDGAALQRAPGGGIRVRAMRTAGQHQLAHAGTMTDRELLADQRAIRIADEGFQRADAEMIQHQRQCVGLIGGIDRHVQRTVGADEIERQYAQLLRIQRAPPADQLFGPALLAELCVGGHMAMRGDAAGQYHHRRVGRADPLVAQAHRAGAGMTHRQHRGELTALGMHTVFDRHADGDKGFGANGGTGGEAHGGIRLGNRPSSLRGARVRDARVVHGSNHLSVDATVPAGFGTYADACAPAGCPGFKGPVPLPVSMVRPRCQPFRALSIPSCG